LRFLPFILKHLGRTWIRTGSTVAAMAICVFLFCVLQSVLAQLDGVIQSRSPRRLVVQGATSPGLPLSHGERIRALPGVRRVAAGLMFAGFLRARKEGKAGGGSDFASTDWTAFFNNMAVEAEPYFAMNPEFTIPPDQFRDFLRDPRGCVVGRALADKFGWKIGDRFFLESIVAGFRKPDGPFEFVIRGFMDTDLTRYPGTSTDGMFFHLRYLDVLPDVRGWTVNYMIEVDDPGRAPEVATAVDELFENSGHPTVTDTEQAFMAEFINQAGDLSTLLNGIGAAVCFSILLVTANTMSMAVRERRTEIAVLKTLGFTSAAVMGLIVAEALLLGALGGALGIGGTHAVLWILNRIPAVALPGLSTLYLRLPVALLGLAVALFLGFAAGFMPAWGAYRAKVTEMLRAV
jgi:putative ABC transport system permease protein